MKAVLVTQVALQVAQFTSKTGKDTRILLGGRYKFCFKKVLLTFSIDFKLNIQSQDSLNKKKYTIWDKHKEIKLTLFSFSHVYCRKQHHKVKYLLVHSCSLQYFYTDFFFILCFYFYHLNPHDVTVQSHDWLPWKTKWKYTSWHASFLLLCEPFLICKIVVCVSVSDQEACACETPHW